MKLYFTPGACSMASHILINEFSLPHVHESVDLKTHKTKSGQDYYQINPKGYVPALALENGEIMTENIALLLYLSDLKKSIPQSGMPRYRLIEWLAFISTEIHKSYGPLFSPVTPQETVKASKEKLAKRYEYIDQHLASKQFVFGDSFGPADAYLFTVTKWASKLGVDLSPWENVTAFMTRLETRPSIQTTFKEEAEK